MRNKWSFCTPKKEPQTICSRGRGEHLGTAQKRPRSRLAPIYTQGKLRSCCRNPPKSADGSGGGQPPISEQNRHSRLPGGVSQNYILREMPRLSRNQRKKDENRRIKKEREPQPARGEPARTVTLKAQRNGKAILARCRSGCNTQPAGAGGFIFNGQRTGKAGNPQPD